MGAVSDFFSDVGDAVGDVVSSVGDVVEDVGDTIVNEVVAPIAETVEKTVEAAMEDPIGTAVKVYAYSTGNPLLIAAANTTVALANGADMDQALESGAKGYVAGQIGQNVAEYVGPEAAEYFGPEYAPAARATTSAAANVSSAVALGQDPVAALIGSGINSSAAEIAKTIPGFDQLSKSQQRAAVSAISVTIQGKDPTQALINEAIAGGIDAANKAINTPDINPNAGYHDPVYDPPATVEELNQQLFPDDFVPDEIGSDPFRFATLQPIGPPPSEGFKDEQPSLESPVSATENLQEAPAQTPIDEPPAEETPSLDEVNVVASREEDDPFDAYNEQFMRDYYDSIGIDYDLIPKAAPMEEDPLAYLDPDPIASSGKSMGQIFKSFIPGGSVPSFDTSSITPALQNAAAIGIPALTIGSMLDENGNPMSQAALEASAFNWNPAAWQAPEDAAAYGYGQLNPTYAAHGGLMSLARGGIATLGGYSDGGRLLKGPGDGMSDHIPAMIGAKQPARLADGEFVIPADVVSHLGNGSTEAGANVLYKMMSKVRRARTGKSKQGKQINPKKFIPS